ncbi:MAG TPA: methyltransferase domain-containing protein [Actinoplanes sp.]|nr:methyltransferase domain-containing protein [Actinoplanes sp.]
MPGKRHGEGQLSQASDRNQVYDSVAERYDRERSPELYDNTLSIYLDMIRGAAPYARRILDLGCGTGRLTAMLAERGYDVVGLDSSAGMLRVAEGRGSSATFVQADILDLPDLGSFDVILTTGQPFNYLASEQELTAVMVRLYSILGDKGVLMFDGMSRRSFERMVTSAYVQEVDGTVLACTAEAEGADLAHISMIERRFEPRGDLWQLTMSIHKYSLFDSQAVRRAVVAAGFTEPDLHGIHRDFHQEFDDDLHAICLVVARR